MKKNKGFTLVELIVVIAIIGILAAVLVPNVMGYIEKSRISSDMQDVASMNRILSAEAIIDDVAYYEAYEVERILLDKGYTLIPRVSKYTYWYDRATNKVLLLNEPPVKSTTDVIESNIIFRNDRVEAVSYECPSYLYIDRKDNDTRRAIETIRDFLQIAKSNLESPYTKDDVLNEMVSLFDEVMNINGLSDSVKDHLLLFSPEYNLYVDDEGFYTTAEPLNGLLTVNRIMISRTTTTIPEFSTEINYAPKIQVTDGKVIIPKSVTGISNGALTNLQSNVVIFTKSRALFDATNLNQECKIVSDFNTNQTMVVPIFYELDINEDVITFSCKQDRYVAIPKDARLKFDVESLNVKTSFTFETSLSYDYEIGLSIFEIILIDEDNSIFAKGIIKFYEI